MRMGIKSESTKGIAVLALLALIMITITSAKIASISLNKQDLKQSSLNTKLLKQLRKNLLGFALQQAPAGQLPCPDTTGDGLENRTSGICDNDIGLFPFQTLNMNVETDAHGAPVWYSVALNYTRNDFPTTSLNSSLASNLMLDGNPAAAILFLPGEAINTQTWTSINAINYLEGENADGDTDFTAQTSNTTNDRVSAIDTSLFWQTIEQRVLAITEDALTDYRNNCGNFPSASITADGTSNAGTLSGFVPFSSGSDPVSCTTPVPLLTNSSWVHLHWNDQIHYRVCADGDLDCISISGDVTATPDALIVSPGIPIGAQDRTILDLPNFYEDDNTDNDLDYIFRNTRNLSDAFNDQIKVLEL